MICTVGARSALFWLVVGAAFTAASAPADWLEMKDGSRLETEGPWIVKGRQVIFTTDAGVLSTVRASEVDLDKSAATTAAGGPEAIAAAEASRLAAEAEASSGTERRDRRPAIVWTQKDLKPRTRPAVMVTEDGVEVPVATPSGVTLVDWRQTTAAEGYGVEIVGSVRNDGAEMAAEIVVEVTLTDPDGNEVTAEAFLEESLLTPRESTGFRAVFPDLLRRVGEPKFALRAVALADSAATGRAILAAGGIPDDAVEDSSQREP